MKAILSDIHGNLEALQAVLQDVALHNVEAIYSLGDLVGYGPNPRECVDLAVRWPVVLLGDHDQTAVPGQADCVLRVNRAVLWARCQLDAPVPDSRAADRRLRFLGGRPLTHREADLLF